MICKRDKLLLFDTEFPKLKTGLFSKWMEWQKNRRLSGHTLITTFNIDYEFVSKALNGLFYNRHECTILRSTFPQIPEQIALSPLKNINIYPFQINKKSHIKMLISINSKLEYFIAFGSANITPGGIGGHNLEFIKVFSNLKNIWNRNCVSKIISKPLKDYLTQILQACIKDEVESISTLPGKNILKISKYLEKIKATGSWPKIIDNREEELLPQIFRGKKKIKEIYIISPYHGVRKNIFSKYFDKPAWLMDKNPEILKDAQNSFHYYSSKTSGRKLHAKAYLVKENNKNWIFFGSANCTVNALNKNANKNKGQLELLLYNTISLKEYESLLNKYKGDKVKPALTYKNNIDVSGADDKQLLCVNINTTAKNKKIIFTMVGTKNKSDLIIIDPNSKSFRVNKSIINRRVSLDSLGKELRKLFENDKPSWVYQRINKKHMPVPVNYEGQISYNEDVSSLEDEIIYCFSDNTMKKRKKKKQKKNGQHEKSSLTHESELDVWFKKIVRIIACNPSQESIELLKIHYKNDKQYKYDFLNDCFKGRGK